MIEISFGKLVLLALVALIVLGPEKLPGAARTAGALVRRMRNGWDSVRAEVERELQVEEIKRTAREAAARAEALQGQLKDGVQQARDPLEKVIEEAAAMARSAPTPEAAAAGRDTPEDAATPAAELPSADATLPATDRNSPA